MATPTRTTTLAAWSDHLQRLAGRFLLAGSLVPLLKRSLLFDASYLVWPWQLAGLGIGVEERAAAATAASGENLATWALLPLVGGLIALALPRLKSVRARSLAGAVTGAAILVLLLLVLVRENAVLGLVFTPPTRGGGALMLLGIGACSVLAAANHTAKTAPPDVVPRWLAIAASLVVIALASIFLLITGDAWAAWSLRALYLSIIGYALLGLWRTMQPQDTLAVTAWASTLSRIILGWSLVAVVLAQSGSHDGFATYVIEAGGGPLHVAIGAVKGFLIFVGAALLFAAGMTTTLEAGSGRGDHRPEAIRVPTATRSAAAHRVHLTALVGVLLASALAGCSSTPADLAKAVAAVGSMLSPHGLERSAFYAVHPKGTPSEFVSFLFSPLGKAEWVPDDSAAPGRAGLVSADAMLAAGDELPPGTVGLVPDAPEPRIHRQVVLRADDQRGVVIAEAYELPGHAPVLVHEWKLPRVTLAPGVAEMARENLEDGVDAGAD